MINIDGVKHVYIYIYNYIYIIIYIHNYIYNYIYIYRVIRTLKNWVMTSMSYHHLSVTMGGNISFHRTPISDAQMLHVFFIWNIYKQNWAIFKG